MEELDVGGPLFFSAVLGVSHLLVTSFKRHIQRSAHLDRKHVCKTSTSWMLAGRWEPHTVLGVLHL